MSAPDGSCATRAAGGAAGAQGPAGGLWAPFAAALYAASLGWPVFPLRAGGKTPAIRSAHPAGHPCRGECGRDGHGFHDATTDPDRLHRWWRAFPRANYGISTGPAELVVIDLDTGKGTPPARVLPDQGDEEPTPEWVQDGVGVLAWMVHRDHPDAGPTGIATAGTLGVRTPSGGLHLYYAAPGRGLDGATPVRSSVGCSAGRVAGLGWCIDVRAGGGYVAGPGSTTPDGVYRALNRGARPGPLPAFLAARLARLTTGATGTAGAPCTTAPRGGSGLRVGPGNGFFAAAKRGELDAIARATAGDKEGAGRNATVNRAAFKLGQLLDQYGQDADAVAEELVAAAMATGLPEREARTAVASGLAQGKARPRALTAV